MRGRPGATLLLGLLSAAAAARADGLQQLHDFMAHAQGGQADFTQQVTSRDGKSQPAVNGTLAFQRPGRFRWDVQKPYHQLIVADGKALWLWDPDLNQVTMKGQDKALGASPAALLAGNNARLEQDFRLQARPDQDGLEWVEATPRNTDAGFDSIRLGFRGDALARMDLKDSFGQLTQIHFGRFQALAHAASLFQFTPPAGADVIRE